MPTSACSALCDYFLQAAGVRSLNPTENEEFGQDRRKWKSLCIPLWETGLILGRYECKQNQDGGGSN